MLQLLPLEALQECCKAKEINTIRDLTQNVLEHYKVSENLYLENYENIGFRNMAAKKANSIDIKVADIGIRFVLKINMINIMKSIDVHWHILILEFPNLGSSNN